MTFTRPDTQEIVVVNNQASYLKLIDLAYAQAEQEHRELAKKLSGWHGPNLSVTDQLKRKTSPLENSALHTLGWMLTLSATHNKVPYWLAEGFGAYCQQVVTGKVLVYTISYEMHSVNLGPHWDAAIKKYAQQGKLKTWEHVFPLDLVSMKPLDYLTGYSVVSYLIQRDPRRFIRFLLNLRDGMDSFKALEGAYGQKIKDLQAAWGQWTLSLR